MTSPNGPPLPLNARQKVGRVLLAPVHAVLWVWYAPRWLRAALASALVMGIVGGTYFFAVVRPEQKRKFALTQAWFKFDAAAAVGHEPVALEALASVLELDPANEIATRRKLGIETGDADPADTGMGVLTVRGNLRKNRLAEAEREATKRLAHNPFDWVSHCARATAAFSRGDRATGIRFVNEIPLPDHPRTRPDAGGLLTAFRLFREAGRDPTPLRVFLRNIALKDLGCPADVGGPPAYKLQRIECYTEAFDIDPDKPPEAGLVSYWATGSSLADRAMDEALATGDVATLAGLGRVGARLSANLFAFRRAKQITEEQYPALRKELDERNTKAWTAVVEREPKNPDAYHGLALLKWRAGDYAAAREHVARGLATCGEDPQLYAMMATILRVEDRPQDASAAIWRVAERNPDKVIWWVLAAEASVAARRRDLAIAACDRGLQAAPGLPSLVRAKAGLHLEAGDSHKALELLNSLGDPALLAEAATARMYARALTASGLGVLVDDFLTKAEKPAQEEGSKVGSPRIAAGAFRGVLDSEPSADRAASIADRAGKLLAKWVDHPDLLRVRADALAHVAEVGEPRWQPIRVAAAVKAYELVRAKKFTDLGSASALARLRLKGERRPDLALKDIAVVRTAEPIEPVAVDSLEILGAVLAANEQEAEAVRVLEKVRRTGRATAGGLSVLAMAYHKQGQRPAAIEAFQAAGELPLTDRARPDYLLAARTLRQEKP